MLYQMSEKFNIIIYHINICARTYNKIYVRNRFLNLFSFHSQKYEIGQTRASHLDHQLSNVYIYM